MIQTLSGLTHSGGGSEPVLRARCIKHPGTGLLSPPGFYQNVQPSQCQRQRSLRQHTRGETVRFGAPLPSIPTPSTHFTGEVAQVTCPCHLAETEDQLRGDAGK